MPAYSNVNNDSLFPTLFVSHGSPSLLQTPQHPEYQAIVGLANSIPRPEAIVVISAHWVNRPVSINNVWRPKTIHDFYGFPDPLYQIRYPAKGDPLLAQHISELLEQHGIDSQLDQTHGLDHGAWAPLLLMYPDADIPVVQVSLPASNLVEIAKMGEALSALRKQSILILASGGSVHNLAERNSNGLTADWALDFEEWLNLTITNNRFDDLVTPNRFPTSFSKAHPTAEHYAPLIVAWAAAGKVNAGKRLHQGFCYDNIGMSHYLFGDTVN